MASENEQYYISHCRERSSRDFAQEFIRRSPLYWGKLICIFHKSITIMMDTFFFGKCELFLNYRLFCNIQPILITLKSLI